VLVKGARCVGDHSRRCGERGFTYGTQNEYEQQQRNDVLYDVPINELCKLEIAL